MKKIVGYAEQSGLSSQQEKAVRSLAQLFRGIHVEGIQVHRVAVSGSGEFKNGFEKEWAVVCSVLSQLVGTQMLAFKQVMTQAHAQGQKPWAVKNAADALAVSVTNRLLEKLAELVPGFKGHVFASEGIKDNAPNIRVGATYVYHGNTFELPNYVMSIDPIDGTTPFVAGRGGATSGFSIQQLEKDERRINLPDSLSVFATITGPHIPKLQNYMKGLSPQPSKIGENVRYIAIAKIQATQSTRYYQPTLAEIQHELTTAKFAMMNRPYQNQYILDQLNSVGCELKAAFTPEGHPDLTARYSGGELEGQLIWKHDGSNYETRDERLVMVDDGNWTLHLAPQYLAVLGNGGMPEFVAMATSASNFTAVAVDKKNRSIDLIEAVAQESVKEPLQRDMTVVKQVFGRDAMAAFLRDNVGMTEDQAWEALSTNWNLLNLGTYQGIFAASALTSLARESDQDMYPRVHSELKAARYDHQTGVISTSGIVASSAKAEIVSTTIPLTINSLVAKMGTLIAQSAIREYLGVAKDAMELCYKYGEFDRGQQLYQEAIQHVAACDPEQRAVVSLKQSHNLSSAFIEILKSAAALRSGDKPAIEQMIHTCEEFLVDFPHVSKHEVGGQVTEIVQELRGALKK